jgi:hypothetical protein
MKNGINTSKNHKSAAQAGGAGCSGPWHFMPPLLSTLKR